MGWYSAGRMSLCVSSCPRKWASNNPNEYRSTRRFASRSAHWRARARACACRNWVLRAANGPTTPCAASTERRGSAAHHVDDGEVASPGDTPPVGRLCDGLEWAPQAIARPKNRASTPLSGLSAKQPRRRFCRVVGIHTFPLDASQRELTSLSPGARQTEQ
jgi:hypothetical protein